MKTSVQLALLLLARSAVSTTPCPAGTPFCKKLGEECGLDVPTVFLCEEGLVCQEPDTLSEQTELKARITGTCQAACNDGHVPANGFCAPACQVEDTVDNNPENWLTVLNGKYLNVDTCGNRCKCDASNNFEFTCAENSPCAKPDGAQCTDVPDKVGDVESFTEQAWVDSEGNGCDWYASQPLYCSAFGSKRAGPGGRTAGQTCCVCGGGLMESAEGELFMELACEHEGRFGASGITVITDRTADEDCDSHCKCLETTVKDGYLVYDWECTLQFDCEAPEECEDITLAAKEDASSKKKQKQPQLQAWEDQNGRTCEWYAGHQLRCAIFDGTPGLGGYTAFDACCFCGGGLVPDVSSTKEGTDGIKLTTPVLGGIIALGVLVLLLLCTSCCLCKTKKELNAYKAMGPRRESTMV